MNKQGNKISHDSRECVLEPKNLSFRNQCEGSSTYEAMSKECKENLIVRYETLRSQMAILIASIAENHDPSQPLSAYFDRVHCDPDVMLVFNEMQELETLLPLAYDSRKLPNPK